METTTEILPYQKVSNGKKLADIALSKIKGQKKDYFLHYKYDLIAEYYGHQCLDVGAGNGSFSNFLQSKNHVVSAIDIVDQSNPKFLRDITLFDGRKIPFATDDFDTSILMFVLHHTDHQQELLQDCIRVTRNYIIVAEDIIQNLFDTWMGAIHLNTSPWSKGFNSFKNHRGWLAFFAKNDLEVVEAVEIPRWAYPVYPIARRIYVLKVNK